jgi:MFS family permease
MGPVLLLGPLGLSFAMLSFGLSNNYWILLVSRAFRGVFMGTNILSLLCPHSYLLYSLIRRSGKDRDS